MSSAKSKQGQPPSGFNCMMQCMPEYMKCEKGRNNAIASERASKEPRRDDAKNAKRKPKETPVKQSDIQNAFVRAIQGGDTDKMRSLIKKGANANDHSHSSGENLLVAARNVAVLKVLTEAGADVNYKRKGGGFSALESYASREYANEYIAFAKVLLEAGADINIQNDYGGTPLMSTIIGDHFKMARFLIQSGADLNIQENGGETALIRSIGRSERIAELLVQAGADQSIQTESGDTALKKATRLKFDRFKEILSHGGAKETVQETSGPKSSVQRKTNNSSQTSHAENRNASGSRTSKRNDKRTKDMPAEPSLIEGVLKGVLQSIF